MSRENEFYRAELEGLLSYFGQGKNVLTCTEVARYCGMHRTTAQKRFEIGREGIPLRKLALKLSNL